MQNDEIMTGTTIIAIKIKDGIVIGADTRTSLGSFIPDRTTNKLTKLTDRIYCCRSGSAADTKIITDICTSQNKQYQYADGTLPTVRRLAMLCKNMIYQYPQLLAGIIVAGYDEEEKGSIYNVTLGGSMVKMDISLGGSGSPYIYGFCDKFFKADMTREEGISFVSDAVSMAIGRDNFSGGCVRMAVITKEGVEKIFVPGNEIKV
ncbi:Proteasome subunit beta type-1 [Conglomerata obtusa]